MKILVLEDNPERIKYFRELLKVHDLFITKDIQIALDFLRLNECEIIFLDHDLGQDYLTSLNNGYELVKKIVELELQPYSQFYIHSMNPNGANRMVNLLKDNDYKAMWHPFSLMR
jgi:CheY-like chemotaxis protein